MYHDVVVHLYTLGKMGGRKSSKKYSTIIGVNYKLALFKWLFAGQKPTRKKNKSTKSSNNVIRIGG